MTDTGSCVGTIFYMSPEVCLGKPADARSDIYALGCIIYECLTGITPLTAQSTISVMKEHVNVLPPAPSEKSSTTGFPAHLDPIVLKALAKDPADRYQSMDELAADLKLAAAGVAPKCAIVAARANRMPAASILASLAAILIVMLAAFTLSCPGYTIGLLKSTGIPKHTRIQMGIKYAEFFNRLYMPSQARSIILELRDQLNPKGTTDLLPYFPLVH